MPHAVLAESVSASYREGGRAVPVLDAASFTIEQGVFTALTGPSGSGKTTLLSLLGALDVAEGGRLVVAGAELTALGAAGRARFRRTQVGFVFQGFNLLPTLTVRENVEVGLEPLGLGRTAARGRAEAALDRVAMLTKAQRFPHELSGGEQQRVAVARACAKNPPLLLADEPTGNLDEEAGARVMDLIGAARDEGQGPRTVIVVTHDASVAARADAVLTLHDHKVYAG
ncbi:MAG: ABC transporter ATP-binding protein [Planctomycetota bacterium]|nr:ABC transporter ATP-binding protein [Planctomycetota bacterium]